MAIKNAFQQSIYHLLKHNHDGSHETQGARRYILFQAAKDLVQGGFKLRHVQGLKSKHLLYLNKLWKENQLAIATIKNRNAHLRWLCEKINKPDMMPSNDSLGTGRRGYANSSNKALQLQQVNFEKITNRHVLVSIHLQRHLGLRREESLKIKPHQANKGNYLELQASWCKGKRAREVPILSDAARYWLNEAKKLVASPEQSLIPPDKKYIQQRNIYDKQTRAAGIKHAHGLRHAYAQERYQQLTGRACPKAGGVSHHELTRAQREVDRNARLIISEELGHAREQITVAYLGR